MSLSPEKECTKTSSLYGPHVLTPYYMYFTSILGDNVGLTFLVIELTFIGYILTVVLDSNLIYF